MVDERPEETELSPDSLRPKRTPPTIDLEATEVSSGPTQPADEPQPEPAAANAASAPPVSEPPPQPISPWVVAPISGAVAAALVIAVGWLLGWPAVQPASPAAPQPESAAIGELSTRVAGLETRLSKAAVPVVDPATSARIDAVEKSLSGLRGELATTRAQSEKLAAAVQELKSTPRDGVTAAPDLSAINARIDKIESAIGAQAAAIAQQDSKITDAKTTDGKPADDGPLRRVVAAALLDVAVRHGDPYTAALEAAKSLAEDPTTLKPLDAFAASGVPNAPALCRELLEIVPKLEPPAPEVPGTTGSGLVNRLQAGAAKLVRIQRTDGAGTDRGSVVARVTAAALHNDLSEARRQLQTLAPADRAAAQAWLDKLDARDAALAASRKFADDAMAGLAKTRQ
jgi:hypothetical protein